MKAQNAREAYERYYGDLDREGVALAKYACPNCEVELKVQIPDPDEIWDSGRTCPYCEALHYYAVHDDGHVFTRRLG